MKNQLSNDILPRIIKKDKIRLIKRIRIYTLSRVHLPEVEDAH